MLATSCQIGSRDPPSYLYRSSNAWAWLMHLVVPLVAQIEDDMESCNERHVYTLHHGTVVHVPVALRVGYLSRFARVLPLG